MSYRRKTIPRMSFVSSQRLVKSSFIINIATTVLLAVLVFVCFVLLLRRSGYNALDYRPFNLYPPIPIYLADYSLCFASKLLIGSITKLFSFQLTLTQLYNICVTMNIIALCIVSILSGALLRWCISTRSYLCLLFTLIFVLNPIVPQENYPAIGSYDTYWLVIFALLFLLCNTSSFAFAAPMLCFVGMLVHFGFLFTFLPCIAALLVYDLFNAPKKSKRVISGISFGITGISSAAVLFWSFFFQNDYLKMTGAEFHDYMLSRLKLTGVEEIRLRRLCGDNLFPYDFFEIYFFNNRDGEVQTSMAPRRFLELFWGYLKNSTGGDYYLQYAILLLPFLILLVVFWFICTKKANGMKKLPFICFAGIETLFFASCVFSTDLYRYGAAAMISQISLLLAMFLKNDVVFHDVLDSPFLRKKWFIALAAIAGIAYIAVLLKLGIYLPRTPDR